MLKLVRVSHELNQLLRKYALNMYNKINNFSITTTSYIIKVRKSLT